MLIKIINSDSNRWYTNRIGQSLQFDEETDTEYIITNRQTIDSIFLNSPHIKGLHILKTDCEIES